MVVTGKVHNIHQLGPFIYRLCNGKDTYRLNRRVTHRRKLGLMKKKKSIERRSLVTLDGSAVCVSVSGVEKPVVWSCCDKIWSSAHTEQSHIADLVSASHRFPYRYQQAWCKGLPPHPSFWEYVCGGDDYLRWSVNTMVIGVIPPTQRHISSYYPSHCSTLLWIWSRLSCTLLVILVRCPL